MLSTSDCEYPYSYMRMWYCSSSRLRSTIVPEFNFLAQPKKSLAFLRIFVILQSVHDTFEYSSMRRCALQGRTWWIDCWFVALPASWLLRQCLVEGLHKYKKISPCLWDVPLIIDGSLMKFINARFRLSLDINVMQEHQKIVLWNVESCSRSNMILILVISQNAPEILSSFAIWIWISGFFFSLWRNFQKFQRGVASSHVDSGG